MRARHVGVGSLFAVAYAVVAGTLAAQADDDWRSRFAAGEEAREAGNVGAYAREMASAAASMPDGHLNRPFVQYHAARAAALDGRPADAVRWLRAAWDEDIEALMISFARYDPAFEAMAGRDDFEEVMGRAASMRLEAHRLRGDVYLIQGAGSNVVAQVGDDGVLLVDTGYGPALPAVRRALESVGGGSPRWLVLTHPHEDHMGAADELGADAVVHAHPGTTAQMREPYVFMEGVEMPPKGAAALPDVEIVRDTTLRFNGEEVRLVPTVAHTAGDLTVWFTGSGVVHFGDAYLAGNPMMFPGTDDPDGFLDRLDALLDEMPSETIVVGGHEAVATPEAVRAQIDASRACLEHARRSIRDGLTLEQAVEAAGDRFPPPWVAFFYRLEAQRG